MTPDRFLDSMSTPEELAEAISKIVVGGATTSPCRPETLSAAERRLGLRFPSDVCAFYRRTNGTADMTDTEHGLITFWPLEKWERVEDEAP
jgi:cell wall assembly regulator SMI1